jgi:hypothetical protein
LTPVREDSHKLAFQLFKFRNFLQSACLLISSVRLVFFKFPSVGFFVLFPTVHCYVNIKLYINYYSCFRLLYAGLEQLRDRHFPDLSLPPLASLVNKLEVVACDTRTTNFRPSELAVALLRRDLISLAKTDAAAVAARTACLQPLITLCKVCLALSKLA